MHNLGQKWPKFDIFAPRVCDISLERNFYADSCIIMHVTYTILFSSLPGIMTKVCVKFHPDPMNGF